MQIYYMLQNPEDKMFVRSKVINLRGKNNITREEFAQVMFNIFKTYLPDNGEVKNASYGTTVVRAKDVIMENITNILFKPYRVPIVQNRHNTRNPHYMQQ